MTFVVLPDTAAAAAVSTRLAAANRIDHASGRPWIVGDWHPKDVTVVEAGSRKLAVIGSTPTGRVDADALGRVGSLHELDAIAARLPGSFHLLASIDGKTRIQGSVVGVRQVFTATVDDMTVAADGVESLLRLKPMPLDETLLAARLLVPGGAPWPLAPQPVIKGVEAVGTGHWLQLDNSGRSRTYRWWNLPEATLSLEQGAAAVREALQESLAVRTGQAKTLSADLSGGMDSTSLCFLADEAGADLITYHVRPLDFANEDTRWAKRAADHLPAADHHTLAADRTENLFDVGYTPDQPDAAPEGPSTWASGLAHIHDLAARASGAGSSLHLTGFGGDELFGRMPAGAWALARAHPISGLRLVNRYRLANRWSWRATVSALTDRSTFAENLVRVANSIDAPPPRLDEPDFGWVFAPRMPHWATPDAVSAVRRLLIEAAASTPVPLDLDRSRHQALASLVFEGATVRQVNTALAGTGIVWDAPFLDDRVIEAALATRVDQRLASGRFKPLLVEAVRGIVPDDILSRTDKGEFSAEAFRGLERNRARLLELSEDSQLARLGLIDPAAFRSAVLNPGPMSHHLQPIESTVACESWLRTHSRPNITETSTPR
ncbi:lasso peptide isopeptide bond-forming cyclase [Streptomyces sp. VB1]|uniref:lasso peptide isopeptide bond-forming cyclase n=1 Tax=Streptomyces sp. VB1 TaxID=2986803 RepID=UPI0022418B3B|nr:lasso peptide isopeptide bond-forming cyclase [Streptomyces sp. VB1]UZI32671.1 lasso peptide isopeptide bond-forming cyclase [Streptomyces sp. VB1]